jgi:hypothetical protein
MKEVNVKGGGEAVTFKSKDKGGGEVMLWVGAVPVCDRYVGGGGGDGRLASSPDPRGGGRRGAHTGGGQVQVRVPTLV